MYSRQFLTLDEFEMNLPGWVPNVNMHRLANTSTAFWLDTQDLSFESAHVDPSHISFEERDHRPHLLPGTPIVPYLRTSDLGSPAPPSGRTIYFDLSPRRPSAGQHMDGESTRVEMVSLRTSIVHSVSSLAFSEHAKALHGLDEKVSAESHARLGRQPGGTRYSKANTIDSKNDPEQGRTSVSPLDKKGPNFPSNMEQKVELQRSGNISTAATREETTIGGPRDLRSSRENFVAIWKQCQIRQRKMVSLRNVPTSLDPPHPQYSDRNPERFRPRQFWRTYWSKVRLCLCKSFWLLSLGYGNERSGPDSGQ